MYSLLVVLQCNAREGRGAGKWRGRMGGAGREMRDRGREEEG